MVGTGVVEAAEVVNADIETTEVPKAIADAETIEAVKAPAKATTPRKRATKAAPKNNSAN